MTKPGMSEAPLQKKYRYDELNRNEFESHMLALNSIDSNTKILEIGCATGYLAKELLGKGCETWGVDVDSDALKKASKYCKKVVLADVNSTGSLPMPDKYFDYVLLMDVLEHLINPEKVLNLVKQYLKVGGKIIVSSPNIAHLSVRVMLMGGNFDYTETGMMDREHVHFYTRKTLARLLEKHGYLIKDILPTNGVCKVPLIYLITDRLSPKLQYRITCLLPNLFSYQFLAIAEVGE